MSAYPVSYAQSPPEDRNRLTVFFRYFTAIPHLIVACFYGIAAFLAVVVAWFAIVFTGRWPAGMYDFVAGFVRFLNRVQAYLYLVVDEYPPFDGGEHPEYPVVTVIAPAKEEYSRVKTFFRGILAIPILIVQYAMGLWLMAVAVVLWFAGVFMGKTSESLTEAQRTPMAYYIRSMSYFLLLTEDWPPFDPGTNDTVAETPAPPPQPPVTPDGPSAPDMGLT